MQHLNIDIQNASWLNDDQKSKLCKAFDAVKMKDIFEQSIEMLELEPDNLRDYRDLTVTLLRVLTIKGVSEAIGSEEVQRMGKYLVKLFDCFDVWQNDNMELLIRIYDVYSAPADRNIDEDIENLMKDMELN